MVNGMLLSQKTIKKGMRMLAAFVASLVVISTIASAQTMSFMDKALIPPDVAFLWNFQRGVEEVMRFVKFSTTMRVAYSLDLMDRRVGELEYLANRSQEAMMPAIANSYELEAEKIMVEMSTEDPMSYYTGNLDIKENVTSRLRDEIKGLEMISGMVSKETRDIITNAQKRTTVCLVNVSAYRP
jgi:hypothetical protein